MPQSRCPRMRRSGRRYRATVRVQRLHRSSTMPRNPYHCLTCRSGWVTGSSPRRSTMPRNHRRRSPKPMKKRGTSGETYVPSRCSSIKTSSRVGLLRKRRTVEILRSGPRILHVRVLRPVSAQDGVRKVRFLSAEGIKPGAVVGRKSKSSHDAARGYHWARMSGLLSRMGLLPWKNSVCDSQMCRPLRGQHQIS